MDVLVTIMIFTKDFETPANMTHEALNKKHYKTPTNFINSLRLFVDVVLERSYPDIFSYEPSLKRLIEMCWKQELKERFVSF
ncbi:hypothetical protein ENUP19_0127G0004 [Entamoeba nuttalli]|uniref:Uncharacterized protein n=1 Tax=Entamoeba nuttalli TaxID=412467 RepID=A0ABQ0DJI2_9EUKA